jgi:hypothetical protein
MTKRLDPNGIPLISEGLADIYLRDFESIPLEQLEERANEMQDRSELVNPNFLKEARKIARHHFSDDPEGKEATAIVGGFILAYELIRRQIESNNLYDSYNSQS